MDQPKPALWIEIFWSNDRLNLWVPGPKISPCRFCGAASVSRRLLNDWADDGTSIQVLDDFLVTAVPLRRSFRIRSSVAQKIRIKARLISASATKRVSAQCRKRERRRWAQDNFSS
jgi:hypothetical protein